MRAIYCIKMNIIALKFNTQGKFTGFPQIYNGAISKALVERIAYFQHSCGLPEGNRVRGAVNSVRTTITGSCLNNRH